MVAQFLSLRAVRAVIAVLTVGLIYGLAAHTPHNVRTFDIDAFLPPRGRSTDHSVANRTLGFGKVLAVGLDERSDKRDALALTSSITGFDIEWVNGVKSADIASKAVPFGIDPAAANDNFLGCWRGHMNAMRRVVESGVGSALIMEDDADWDFHLKDQLVEVAEGSRTLFPGSDPEHSTTTSGDSPYGDDWDVLWLGHCGEPLPETLDENKGLSPEEKERISIKHTILDDITVPPVSKVNPLTDWSPYPPHTRLMHITAAPICAFAYAVSLRGAEKILYSFSVNGLHGAIDNQLADLCRASAAARARDQLDDHEHVRLNCLTANPSMVFHHRPKGRINVDSDIQNHGTDGTTREHSFTESIQWSLRLNLENILAGRPLQEQFKE